MPNATDEQVCTGLTVQSDGATAAFYALFPSTGDAHGYVESLAKGATVTSDCREVTIRAGLVACNLTDDSSKSAVVVMYIGRAFTFSSNSTAAGNCRTLGQPSGRGASVIVWAYQNTNVAAGMLACSASIDAMDAMFGSLSTGNLELLGK